MFISPNDSSPLLVLRMYTNPTAPSSGGMTSNSTDVLIKFSLKGADGGRRKVQELCLAKGGEGAFAELSFKIGDEAGQLKPGGLIRFIVGEKGTALFLISCAE